MDDRSTIAALEGLLNQLERRHARTRALALTFGLVAGVLALTAQTARAPSVFGDAGGQRVEIGPTGISLYNASNQRKALLYIDSDGYPNLSLIGPGATTGGVELQATTHAGHLKLSSPAGTERVYLGSYKDDTAGLEISDGTAKQRVYAGTYANGSSEVAVNDPAGQERVRLYHGSNGVPGLGVLSPTGKFIIEANQGNNGGGFVRVYDSGGTDRAYMGIFSDGASGFTAYNASGTATWHGP
ncbi:MAG: hypothetical protein JO101_03185 [Candidatus Eremiobacteraeota bacterium]|nr:hypothetical protein [Candidatus Eremiobacteraeota bacterium]